MAPEQTAPSRFLLVPREPRVHQAVLSVTKRENKVVQLKEELNAL